MLNLNAKKTVEAVEAVETVEKTRKPMMNKIEKVVKLMNEAKSKYECIGGDDFDQVMKWLNDLVVSTKEEDANRRKLSVMKARAKKWADVSMEEFEELEKQRRLEFEMVHNLKLKNAI